MYYMYVYYILLCILEYSTWFLDNVDMVMHLNIFLLLDVSWFLSLYLFDACSFIMVFT